MNDTEIAEKNDVETIATNRGKFIDWLLDKHPEIVREYLGF